MNYSSPNIKKNYRELTTHRPKMATKALVFTFKVFILSIVFIFVVGICFVSGSFVGIIETAPEITLNDVTPSEYKTTVYDKNEIVVDTLVASGANRVYVTIDEIPENLKNAFIAIEDERFYEHYGIDPQGIIRAIYLGVTSNFTTTQGASTITQQLIKNSVFSVENENSIGDTIKRKIQEQYLAVKLEKEVGDKDIILENYLNTINLGNNNLGVQSAATNYFNKDVSELTLSESAVIAAITQYPYAYNPITFPENNAKRREAVLTNMLNQDLITQDDFDEAMADDVYSRIMDVNESSSTSSAYSYYTDALIQQIMDDLMTTKGYTYTQAYNLVYRGGLSIYSCEDSELQEYAEELVNDPDQWKDLVSFSITYRFQVKEPDGLIVGYTESNMLSWLQALYGADTDLLFNSTDEANQYMDSFLSYVLESTNSTLIENSEIVTYTLEPQISLVLIENETSSVRVIVGGRGDKTESLVLNRATSSERQPGSSIKPLVVYAPAIDTAGYTLGTVIDDIPFYYDNGQLVQNSDELYRGYVTLRQALAESRNIPALKVLDSIGISTGITYLKNFGISTITDNDYYLPIALGTASVTNYEMTAAYTTFANEGAYTEPKLYTKIIDHDGNIVLDNTTSESTQVIKKSTAWLMTSALHSVLTQGTLGGLDVGGLYISAKTGTTQNDYDKWVIGYTDYYTAGVWMGYDSNKELVLNENYVYINIWNELLQKANEGLDATTAPEIPDDIVSVEICKDSGLLAVSGLCDEDPRGDRVTTEYYVVGTEPTQYCDVHTEVSICESTGDLATVNCPPEEQKTVIRIIKDLTGIDLEKFKIEDVEYAITEEMIEEAASAKEIPTAESNFDSDNEDSDSDNEDSDSDNEDITDSTTSTEN